MKRFKFTYQDRALNKHIEIWKAQSWTDAIVLAFSLKKAEWKLLSVEQALTLEEEAAYENVKPTGPMLCWFDDESGKEPTYDDFMEAAKKFGEKTVTDLGKIRYGRDVLTRDDVIRFNSESCIAELEEEDLDDHTLWPKENPYLKNAKPPERTQKYFERVLGDIKKEKS